MALIKSSIEANKQDVIPNKENTACLHALPASPF